VHISKVYNHRPIRPLRSLWFCDMGLMASCTHTTHGMILSVYYKSWENWKQFSPRKNIPTSHKSPTCQVRPTQNGTTKDEMTKKSRDLKCFSPKHLFFSHPSNPYPPTRTHPDPPINLARTFHFPVRRLPTLPFFPRQPSLPPHPYLLPFTPQHPLMARLGIPCSLH
jgi:hypothetical protein